MIQAVQHRFEKNARKHREGAAMLIVMLVLLMSTAAATFAVHSTTFEIRAAGHMRQALQTEYVAETGLLSTLAMVDQIGPQSILYAMEQSTPTNLAPYEPALAAGKRAYRIYMADFNNTPGRAGLPMETSGAEASLGQRQTYEPLFMVDVTDDYTFTGVVAGERSDGYAKMTYLLATYTSRGRTVISASVAPDGDHQTAGDTRGYHEGANIARASGLSGPFGR